MKKIASILLIAVMLFNLGGYRWVMDWMQRKADTRLEAQLDKNEYDESSLIEIRIPLDIPYQTQWKDFERCDGAIEVNNIHYKYVKRKIENGFLVLKCIPNETRQALVNAKDYFFQLVNDLEQAKPAKKSNSSFPVVIKTVLGDYDELVQMNFTLPGLLSNNSINLYSFNLILNNLHNTPEQPPETIGLFM